MKTILIIAYKTLLEMIREIQILLIIFLFPVLMIGLYSVAYGDTGGGLSSQFKLSILNQQAKPEAGTLAYDQELIGYLQDLKLDEKPVFSLSTAESKASALTALQEKQILAILVIPQDFQQSIEHAKVPARIEIIGDTYSAQFTFVQSFLTGALDDFNRTFKNPEILKEPAIQVNYKFLEGTGTMSDLDFGLPGVLVFGLMFLSISTTQLLVREKSNRTLLRYRMSGISTLKIFFGLTLSQIVIALVLVPFSMFAAALMGFHARGSIFPLLLISSILTIAAVGIGLIVACFTKNESEAINISSSIVVPLVLLSNTLYPMEKSQLFSIFGMSFSFFDLLPTSVAADLLRNSLIYLVPLRDLLPWILWLCLQTIVIFAIGASLFKLFLFRTPKA